MAETIQASLYRFELISEQQDVSAFDCGSTLINDYLRTKALNETQKDNARTFLLIDTNNDAVIGYITLRADALNYWDAETNRSVSVPVVELSYLGRRLSCRGQGLGKVLLIRALRHVARCADWIGIAGLSLAYTAEGKRLYDQFGFGQHPYGEWLLFLPTIVCVRSLQSKMMSKNDNERLSIANRQRRRSL